ncbi:MAG: RNA polymerase sigma factor [Actinobacteria bacterium]|nr:RNA polymerase sigma factor [Actinomycetota bacterium]
MREHPPDGPEAGTSPPEPPSSDAALMRKAKNDPDAFAEIYRRHAGDLHEWLTRRSPQFAADLTAEAFAQAWVSRRRFRDDRDGSALPWLLGIARNLLRDSERHARAETSARQKLGLPLELVEDAGLASIDQALSPDGMLDGALADLPRHEREAVELRVLEELPYDEVARRLTIRPAAARLRVSRGLRRMSVALQTKEGL